MTTKEEIQTEDMKENYSKMANTGAGGKKKQHMLDLSSAS